MRRRSTFCFFLATLLTSLSGSVANANPLCCFVFELVDRPYSLAIPPDGSVWQSLRSSDVFDTTVYVILQDVFDDDGSGDVSYGDMVFGPDQDGSRPAIFISFVSRLYRLEGQDWVLKPLIENGEGSPVGETWEFLLPVSLYGQTVVVDGWSGEGLPSISHQVLLEGSWYVIENVTLAVEADLGTPVKPSTWGRLKMWFRDVF